MKHTQRKELKYMFLKKLVHDLISIFMVPSLFVDVGRYVIPGINVFLNTIRK